MIRRCVAFLCAFYASCAIGALLTFAWDAGGDYPAGTTYELEANGVTAAGIEATQHTLDVPGQPGDSLDARVRAVAPDGRLSGWAALSTTIPGGDGLTVPLEPVDIAILLKYTEVQRMPVTITGTPVAIALSSSATPGAQNITVPSDAEGVVVFWAFESSTVGTGVSSMSSNFSGTFTTAQLTTASDVPGTGVAYAEVTSTGAKTITPVWTNSLSTGPIFIVAFVKGVNTSDWIRATAFDGKSFDTGTSVSVASTTTDLVFALDTNYVGGTNPPANPTGWTSQQTQGNNNRHGRLRTANSPGASTTSTTGQATLRWSSLSAISIKEGAAAAASLPPHILFNRYSAHIVR